MKLSVLIKALNEEALIANCLEAALTETLKVGGEVILVDSLSTDRTIEIARSYPIRVIQFSQKADCGCAAAVQLGYQYAYGEYLYVLDGDMVLQPDFLSVALNYLESNSDVAGVAGRLLDTSIKTIVDKKRRDSAVTMQQQVMEVSELGGGGLYRRKAIESVGYLAHRWLPACEEAELGARLRAAGWRLIRLSNIAVYHTGHSENNFQMLCRLWRSRRMHAHGMYLRTALGRSWWWLSLRQVWWVFAAPMLHAIAGMLAVVGMYLEPIETIPALIVAELFVWIGVIVVQAVRKKSISDAVFSVYMLHCLALAQVLGAMQPIPDPMIPINARELTKH